MRKQLLGTFIAGVLLSPVTAGAQSYDAQRETQPHYQASVGITIPFGTSGNKVKDQPRLEFSSRRINNDSSVAGWAVKDDYSEQTFGLSLSKKPTLMMNGHELYLGKDERANLSDTMEWVLIGGALVGIVLLASTLSDEERALIDAQQGN